MKKTNLFIAIAATIFAGLDKDDNIKKDSPASNVIDAVYDFTQPSPPATGDDH